MIDLAEFNDLIPKNGHGASDYTRISITNTMCKIILSKRDYEKLTKYFGSTVSIKYSPDLKTFVLVKGIDKRVGSMNRDIHLQTLKESLQETYGGAIWNIYFDTSMDNDKNGNAVFVLTHNGRKEFHADATIHKLKG